jgi:glycosyltransferase involved in cell wall biosynthesis
MPARNRLEFLDQYVKTKKVQLIQSCDAASEGARIAFLRNIPHVWFVGGAIEEIFTGLTAQSAKAFRVLIEYLSEAVVTHSHSIAREEFPKMPAPKLHVIPWGIEPASFNGHSPFGWLKKKLRIPSAAPLVAMVGNFYPAKRHHDFLKAASLIRRRIPQAHFLIAGKCIEAPSGLHKESFRYRLSIVEAIKRLRLQEAVTLTHFSHANRNAWYLEFNLLIVPSQEGMGQAMLEAGACGVPLVAANVGGAPEVIQDKQSGRLVPFQNPKVMARAVIEILRDNSLAKRYGEGARQRILKAFTAARHAQQFERLYQKLFCLKAKRRNNFLFKSS